jgi:hypothetical protein
MASCSWANLRSPLSAAAKLFPSTLFGTGDDEITAWCYQAVAQTQHDLGWWTLNQALDYSTGYLVFLVSGILSTFLTEIMFT